MKKVVLNAWWNPDNNGSIIVEVADRSDNGITIEPRSKGKISFKNVPEADATPENLELLMNKAGYEIDGKNVTRID